LVKDKETGNSKGYGFVLYEDTSVTDVACSGLNGLRMGDKTLTVRRANQGRRQPGQQQQQQQQQHNFFPQANNNAILQQQTIAALASQANPTTVVRLSNCVTEAELMKDDEYKEIVEDMRDEGGRHGEVLEVLIPRPSPPPPPPQPAAEDGDNPTPPPPPAASAQGVGKVYVKYAEVSSAMKAFQAMNGRKFSGNIVVAEFMSEENFAKGLLDD
jgi:splicing factor U2AF subunit